MKTVLILAIAFNALFLLHSIYAFLRKGTERKKEIKERVKKENEKTKVREVYNEKSKAVDSASDVESIPVHGMFNNKRDNS